MIIAKALSDPDRSPTYNLDIEHFVLLTGGLVGAVQLGDLGQRVHRRVVAGEGNQISTSNESNGSADQTGVLKLKESSHLIKPPSKYLSHDVK